MTSLNPNALAEAQSSSEMFDVMRPPRPSFDVYRDRPEPTGETMTRGETHALKMWHRSVHVWLVDPALGLLALQKRSPNKDTFPGRWDISAAGHIESGDESRPTAVSARAPPPAADVRSETRKRRTGDRLVPGDERAFVRG